MCGKRILQVDACRGHDERDSWSVAKRLSTVTLRPNEATVLYNAACVLGSMNKNRKPWTPFARLGRLGSRCAVARSSHSHCST